MQPSTVGAHRSVAIENDTTDVCSTVGCHGIIEHRFCYRCLQSSLRKSKRCPICNKTIDKRPIPDISYDKLLGQTFPHRKNPDPQEIEWTTAWAEFSFKK